MRGKKRKGLSLLGPLFTLIGILTVGILAVGYARGWIQFSDSEQEVNIELDKNAAKDDAKKAVDKTEDLLKSAKDKIHNAVESDEEETPAPEETQQP